MVKGVSRQVIVVHAPDPKLFEQAIFILKDDAVGKDGITDETLMKEAKKIIMSSSKKRKNGTLYCLLWAFCGSVLTGIIWALFAIF